MKKSSKELNFLMSNHISTKRDYLERMNNSKISCMKEAKKYGKSDKSKGANPFDKPDLLVNISNTLIKP